MNKGSTLVTIYREPSVKKIKERLEYDAFVCDSSVYKP